MIKYKLFPTIEEVFVNVTNSHKVVFFPLLTVDLESINKGKGKAHFVAYYRDGEDALINDSNFSYNFMRFKRVGNQYQFNGDFNKIYMFDKSAKWYEEAKEIYAEHKEKYLTNSDFVKEEDKKRMDIDFEYYYYIKGVLNYWLTRDKYLETNKFEREAFVDMDNYDDKYEDEILEETLSELKIDFKDLDYIGLLAGYNYLEFGADEMTLFLMKGEGEVFQYHNWS